MMAAAYAGAGFSGEGNELYIARTERRLHAIAVCQFEDRFTFRCFISHGAHTHDSMKLFMATPSAGQKWVAFLLPMVMVPVLSSNDVPGRLLFQQPYHFW